MTPIALRIFLKQAIEWSRDVGIVVDVAMKKLQSPRMEQVILVSVGGSHRLAVPSCVGAIWKWPWVIWNPMMLAESVPT